MNDLVENCKIDGNVLLDGKDIFKEMDEITLRHRVGMVFQQPNPFPKSVYDNVAYGQCLCRTENIQRAGWGCQIPVVPFIMC